LEGTIASGWSPVIADGVGYIPSGTDFVTFDPATGEVLWRVALNAPASRSASVKDGLAVLGDSQGTVYGISINGGDIVWTHETDATTISGPSLRNGTAYMLAFGETENALLAVDTATGEPKWRFVAPDGAEFRGPAVDDTTVYVGSLTHTLYALDAETGAIQRQTDFSSNWIQGSLLVDGVLYTSTGEAPGRVYALDAATGKVLWELPVDSSTSGRTIVLDGIAYVGTDLGTIYAIGSAGSTASPEAASPESPVATTDAAPVAEASPTVAAADATSEAQYLWATSGEGSDQLDNPLLIRRSPDGHLWVPDISSRFFIFDLDGNLEEVWGSEGSGPGEFRFSDPNNEMGGIAFAADGTFYVLDTFNYRVQHFDRDRTYLGEWGSQGTGDGQFLLATGIAIESDGNILVADYFGGKIHRFDPDGTFLGAFDGTGTPDGKLVGSGMPAVDSNGHIYVLEVDANRVRIFDHDGNQLGVLGESGPDFGGFNYPTDLAIDENGYVYVADAYNNRIVVFGPDGRFVSDWGEEGTSDGQFHFPDSITVNRGGTVYVSDWHGDRIQKFKVTGLSAAPIEATSAS
jgi:outer membrane protein assembly factor BamB